jgi:hypothetical protein
VKQLLLIFPLILSLHSACGQDEKASDKIVADRFEYYYNAGKYDSVFSMFSVDMQNSVTAFKNRDFLSTLKSQAGDITRRQFTKYQGTTAYYKTNFELAIKTVTISVDSNLKIQRLNVRPYTEENLPKIERNTTKLKLPFADEWTVFWGGDTKELNYHVAYRAQKNAFDFCVKDENGKTHRSDGLHNEDYYAFGKTIIAPCDGEVVLAVNGVKDNTPGEMNPTYALGNSVIIMTDKRNFLYLLTSSKTASLCIKAKKSNKGKCSAYVVTQATRPSRTFTFTYRI